MRILQNQRTLRLTLVIFGNALQRIAAGTSGVLVGLYLADLANHGLAIGAALVGTLGAVSFATELIGAVPMGVASDAIAPRSLMTIGSLTKILRVDQTRASVGRLAVQRSQIRTVEQYSSGTAKR